MFVRKRGEFVSGWLEVRFRSGLDPRSARQALVGVTTKGFQYIPSEDVYFVSVLEGKEIDVAADMKRANGNNIIFISHLSKESFDKHTKK